MQVKRPSFELGKFCSILPKKIKFEPLAIEAPNANCDCSQKNFF